MWWDHGVFAQLYLRQLDEEMDRTQWINDLATKWRLVLCTDRQD